MDSPHHDNEAAGTPMALTPARLVDWPLRCGPVPPLADCHSPRPETGLGRIGKLDPGDTLILVPGPPGHPTPAWRVSPLGDVRPCPPPASLPYLAASGGTGKTPAGRGAGAPALG